MSARAKTGSVLLLATIVAGIRLSALAWAAEPTAEEERLPGLMLAKLASSQAIVAGLVSKDFDHIQKGAKDLVSICDATQWSPNADETYARHRQELRRQAIKLTILAEDQNLDGAAFVYMHITSTCINCHQHCRDVLRIAQQHRPSSGVIRIPAADEPLEWSGREEIRR